MALAQAGDFDGLQALLGTPGAGAASPLAPALRQALDNGHWDAASTLSQVIDGNTLLRLALPTLPAAWAALQRDGGAGSIPMFLSIVGAEILDALASRDPAPTELSGMNLDQRAAALASMVLGAQDREALTGPRAVQMVRTVLNGVDATDAEPVVATKALEHLEQCPPQDATGRAMQAELQQAEHVDMDSDEGP